MGQPEVAADLGRFPLPKAEWVHGAEARQPEGWSRLAISNFPN